MFLVYRLKYSPTIHCDDVAFVANEDDAVSLVEFLVNVSVDKTVSYYYRMIK